jgi:asparagine synthase (glutamine-hydrolysing)
LAGHRSRPAPPGEARAFDLVADERGVAIFTGRLFNQKALADQLDLAEAVESPAALMLALYERDGAHFPRSLVGPFAFALLDTQKDQLLIGRDHLGLEPLYYRQDDRGLYFATTIQGVLDCAQRPWRMDYQALARLLMFNYNPGPNTLAEHVYALPAGHVLISQGSDQHQLTCYWRVTFSPRHTLDENELCEALREHTREAVRCRLPAQVEPGLFLSGGLDSSTVAALAGEAHGGSLRTYAFRCDDPSCDESHFARRMAESVEAEHQCVEYGPESLQIMTEAVKHMAEPFDEAGINVASYLLGQRAVRRDAVVLTGDGGDELFAGHPVYQADAMAHYVDRVPGWCREPALATLRSLPDSRRKQDLWVKLKRFAEGLSLPAGLLSNRWRAHYQPAELRAILHPDVASQIDWDQLLAPIIDCGKGAEAEDLLSQSLFADYQSIVHFYLRRNDMLRRLGIEMRCPLLDHRLVEFCAKIPPAMKVPRWSDPKAIMRKAFDPVLPNEIAHRRDKLGHSVPLKNWLREAPRAKQFVRDNLSPQRIEKRGLFEPQAVQTLIDEHSRKKRNNSHRLWTLTVIELWMQQHHNVSL